MWIGILIGTFVVAAAVTVGMVGWCVFKADADLDPIEYDDPDGGHYGGITTFHQDRPE